MSTAGAASSCAPRRASKTFNKDRKAIVITEIPYQVNKARLVERIAQLVNDKIIETIFRHSRRERS